jgi:hypothetical protein
MSEPSKNSEPTTALESLGTVLRGDELRDAVHLAVVPITNAGSYILHPGQHVNAKGEPAEPFVGIVDPFLPFRVYPNQTFWLVLYPRTITSLKHVWTHPAFPDAETFERATDGFIADGPISEDQLSPEEQKRLSEEYLKDRADGLGISYGELLRALEVANPYGVCIGEELEGDVRIEPELKEHAERVLGRKLPDLGDYFRCAC